MNHITLEIISDRPIKINLKSMKVQGALMMAQMGGYVDKRSVKYDPQTGVLTVTVKEKALELLEQQMKKTNRFAQSMGKAPTVEAAIKKTEPIRLRFSLLIYYSKRWEFCSLFQFIPLAHFIF